MSTNYYFIVAGLADIALDEGKTAPFLEFVSEIAEQLEPSDQKLLQWIRFPFDNFNLITLLENSGREFDLRANFSSETLVAAVQNPDELPQYMQAFLESYHENKPVFQGLTWEDQLCWLFYEEVATGNNQFLRDWFSLDMDLRNLIAGINSRKGLAHIEALSSERDRSITSLIVGRNEVAELILRSNAADFGFSGVLPWVDKVLGLKHDSLVEFEKGIDSIRWDLLNQMTVFSYFNVDQILAFAVKLLMAERWRKLDPVDGKKNFERILKELKSGFIMPAGF
jgi:hypothetical protein